MIYLLDADTLIRADAMYYPPKRFPVFWQWLLHQCTENNVRVPKEQYDEVVAGNGVLVDWLKEADVKASVLLDEGADANLVAHVTDNGYAPDLDETELVTLGRDPFLIAYALVAPNERCVVSFEDSAPSKQGANRKVPDVCGQFGVKCIKLFQLLELLDFTTDWKP